MMSSHENENNLALQAQQGDAAAFQTLFNTHYGWVFNIALTHMPTPQDAEEATQDVFIKIWKNLHQWNPEKGTFRSWINKVARNALIDAQRRYAVQYQKHLGTLNEIEIEAEPTYPPPERRLEKHESQVILENLLEQMTKPQHRIAWILHHIEGYTFVEVARILNRSVENVKIWVHRAKLELREMIKHHGYDEEFDL